MHLLQKLALAVLITLPVNNSLQAQENMGKDTLQMINSIFSNWNDSTPGAVLSIRRGNEIIYNQAFGETDLEQKTKNTPETIFEAGSVSKQFTAAAILLLIDRGSLSMENDIREFVPALPDYGIKIRIYDLLHHTSGIKDWSAVVILSGWPRGTKMYSQANVLDMICRQKTLNFMPGTKYAYSNSNYNLLVAVVEKVSGKPFTEFTRDNLFLPLGMSHTQWRDDFRKIIPNRAIAYSKAGKNFFMNMPFENNFGHSGLLTTTGDLLKWNEGWAAGKIGSAGLPAVRLEKGILTNGNLISYASGIFVREFDSKTEISHSGATAGYRSWLAFYPELKLSIAYLSNDGSIDPEGVGEKLKNIFLGKTSGNPASVLRFKAIPIEELKDKAGIYKNVSSAQVIEIETRDTGLFLRNGPQVKTLSKDTLYINGIMWRFAADQLLEIGKGEGIYKKIGPGKLQNEDLKDFAGKYYSEEAEAEVFLEVKDGKLSFFQRPNLRLNLVSVYKDAFFLVAQEKLLVEFNRDKKGKVIDFHISMQRAENIVFKKMN